MPEASAETGLGQTVEPLS